MYHDAEYGRLVYEGDDLAWNPMQAYRARNDPLTDLIRWDRIVRTPSKHTFQCTLHHEFLIERVSRKKDVPI